MSIPVSAFAVAMTPATSPSPIRQMRAPASRTPYFFIDLVHDAMIRPMPQGTFTLSLAEHFEMTEDVKFTFENYKGSNADRLHDMTDRLELIDDRTIVFHFKKPFIDFLLTYIPTASGAG